MLRFETEDIGHKLLDFPALYSSEKTVFHPIEILNS